MPSRTKFTKDEWYRSPRSEGIGVATWPRVAEAEFTERVLLGLIVDVIEREDKAKRVRVQVDALARAHGIKMPAPEDLE